MLGGYLAPLTLIPAVASFLGCSPVGISISIAWHIGLFALGFRSAVLVLLNIIAGTYITAFVIDVLAPNFSVARNFNNAFRMVMYSYTPMIVAGILYLIPSLSVLVLLASLYGIYIFFLGFKLIMKVPYANVTGYFIVSLMILIGVYFVIEAVLSGILINSLYA